MEPVDELLAIENLRTSLVRADPIEAWAPHLFAVEAIPGFTIFVRQAMLCLCRNGTVLYLETSMVGLRLFRRKRWTGDIAKIGAPRPAPAAFVVAKGLRTYDARDRCFLIPIDGSPKIVFFTGITKSRGLPKGTGLMKNIPQAGIILGWAETAVIRARNPQSSDRGKEAAQAWRSVLTGKIDPRALPLLKDRADPPD
jgi:hypothetical protein